MSTQLLSLSVKSEAVVEPAAPPTPLGARLVVRGYTLQEAGRISGQNIEEIVRDFERMREVAQAIAAKVR